MRPLLANYLVNQQMQGQGGGMPQQPPPSSPMSFNNSIPVQAVLQPQQQPIQVQMNQPPSGYNPFDAGISAAMKAAKQVSSMTSEQNNNALRRGLAAFGQDYAQRPIQRGFLNNLYTIGQSLAPALTAYDEAEEKALQENQALAEKLAAYKAAEDKARLDQEERMWNRQFREKQAEENRVFNQARLALQKMGIEAKTAANANKQTGNVPSINGNVILPDGGVVTPIASKKIHEGYVTDTKNIGELLSNLNGIEKKYKKYREKTKNNFIDPMTPYGIGSTVNTGLDAWGYFSDNKNLQEQTTEREALAADLGRFNLNIEKAARGSVLTKDMRKEFESKGLLPDLRKDRPASFEAKLKDLRKELEAKYQAANASLKYNFNINPQNMQSFLDLVEPETARPMTEEDIGVVNPGVAGSFQDLGDGKLPENAYQSLGGGGMQQENPYQMKQVDYIDPKDSVLMINKKNGKLVNVHKDSLAHALATKEFILYEKK